MGNLAAFTGSWDEVHLLQVCYCHTALYFSISGSVGALPPEPGGSLRTGKRCQPLGAPAVTFSEHLPKEGIYRSR